MTIERWRGIAVRETGSSHVTASLECQDVVRVEVLGEEVFAALADGAGSAPHSRDGATRAVDAAIEKMREGTAGERASMLDVARAARDAVLAEAALRNLPPRFFASTLLLAHASAQGARFAQLGDGFVAFGTLEALEVLAVHSPSEHVNETCFLTEPDFEERVFVLEVATVPSLVVLSSDGLERLALRMPERSPVRGFFAPFVSLLAEESSNENAAAEVAAFLRSDSVRARTDDDCSVVVATRRES